VRYYVSKIAAIAAIERLVKVAVWAAVRSVITCSVPKPQVSAGHYLKN